MFGTSGAAVFSLVYAASGADTCSQEVFLTSHVLLCLTLEETEQARVARALDQEPEASVCWGPLWGSAPVSGRWGEAIGLSVPSFYPVT